ncbi:MAG: PorT family protein [Flavobacteriales bacterium]|nr:PorT family protein [Flavobacteriales bacterium]
MKTLFSSILLLLSLVGFSQIEEDNLPPSQLISENWEIIKAGFYFSADLNTVIGETQSDFYSIDYVQNFNHSIGMQWFVQFSDQLELGIEPGYSNKNFTITETCLECEATRTIQYTLRYFQLPIYWKYYVSDSKLDVYFTAGTNFAINLFSNQTIFFNGITNSLIETNSTRILVGGRAGAGINYNLNYRYSLGLDLTYTMFLNRIVSNPDVKSRGLSITPSLLYKF